MKKKLPFCFQYTGKVYFIKIVHKTFFNKIILIVVIELENFQDCCYKIPLNIT